MGNDVHHPAELVAHADLSIDWLRRDERPVVEKRPAHDILARHKSPESRVEAVVPIVAHHEVHSGRDNEIAIDDMVGKVDRPGFWCTVAGIARCGNRRNGWKLVPEVFVIVCCGRLGVRLILSHSIDEDDAVAQMNTIAGNAYQPLYKKRVFASCHRHRLQENNNIVSLWLAVVGQRHPLVGRRESDAIDEEMVTDEERLLHRSRGNDEVLCEKGENEKSHDEHCAQTGDTLGESFLTSRATGFLRGVFQSWAFLHRSTVPME